MSTAAQKELFETIHDRYYEATGDRWAEAYKERFVYKPLMERLAGASSVIELASGNGAGSAWLMKQRPDLDIAGCDISEAAVSDYQALRGRPCYQLDLTKPIQIDRTFDAAFVLGGIHHLVADLPTAFDNIARLLNPGGVLVMTEPNSDYMLEPLRQLWYRLDAQNFDAANEHALSHGRLARQFADRFDADQALYMCGPAYFLLLHNWVLRMPGSFKGVIGPALMAGEGLYHRLPGKLPFAIFMSKWTKRLD